MPQVLIDGFIYFAAANALLGWPMFWFGVTFIAVTS